LIDGFTEGGVGPAPEGTTIVQKPQTEVFAVKMAFLIKKDTF
jgi:hypothetical protein